MRPFKILLDDGLADLIERSAARDDRDVASYLRRVIEQWAYGIVRNLPPLADNSIELRRRPKRLNLKAKVRNSIFERDQGKCAYCNGQMLYSDNWHIDHIQPVSKGGTNEETNLVLSCSRCNLEKSNKEVAA